MGTRQPQELLSEAEHYWSWIGAGSAEELLALQEQARGDVVHAMVAHIRADVGAEIAGEAQALVTNNAIVEQQERQYKNALLMGKQTLDYTEQCCRSLIQVAQRQTVVEGPSASYTDFVQRLEDSGRMLIERKLLQEHLEHVFNPRANTAQEAYAAHRAQQAAQGFWDMAYEQAFMALHPQPQRKAMAAIYPRALENLRTYLPASYVSSLLMPQMEINQRSALPITRVYAGEAQCFALMRAAIEVNRQTP